MAQALRLGIFVVGVALAALIFFNLDFSWAWLAALAIAVAGGIVAEIAFKRLATPEEQRLDLEDRTRNPPS